MNAATPQICQPEGAEALAQILIRCRTVLGNMALENEAGLNSIFNRWPIGHEPLRADAKNLVPLIDEALSRHHQTAMAGSGDVAVSPLDRDKLWHLIAKHIACEDDCQKQPTGCGCARDAADAILAALPSEAIGREAREKEVTRLATIEECAKIAEAQKQDFLSPEYAVNQPFSSICERFACDEVAKAIRALSVSRPTSLSADPRVDRGSATP